MHVISKAALEVFWLKHPNAKAPLMAWYRIVSQTSFENFAAINSSFNSADYVSPFIVFNIGGNNFRLICVAHFNRQKLYVREVFTHAEYDRWNKTLKSKKS
jgi:mRNA interferase HigB